MKLLACFLVLQSTLVVSTKLDELEKLLKDDTQKWETFGEPKKDENYDDQDEEELLEELEDFKTLIDGLCSAEVSRLSKSGNSRLLVGRYVPQCSGDGGYKPEQCHASTGYCWCVNIRTGKEINGTRTRGPLNCSRALSNATSNKWSIRRVSTGSSREHGVKVGRSEGGRGWTIIVGKDIEQIKPSVGSGRALSNAASNGWSVGGHVGHSRRGGWSVGVQGKATWGKDVGKGKGQCADEVSKLGSSKQLVGRYVPQCSGDGGYKPEQCHASTGYCWCVNVLTGKEINGSRTRGPLNCSRALSKAASNGIIDVHIDRIFGDVEEIKPSAENGWSVSASVGSDKDAKQTKPSSANKWQISGSIGSGRDAKQSVGSGRALSNAIYPPIRPRLKPFPRRYPGSWRVGDMEQTKPSAKNGWSVSASVGSDKDAKQTKPSSANKWRISGSIGSGRDAKQSVGSGLCADEVSKLGSSRQLVGRYVPQCSGDGGYKPEQCHASTGYCWCVNVLTGKEINGTRTRGPLSCSRALSNAASNGWSVGAHVGHSRRSGWSVGVGGKITWGKDVGKGKGLCANKVSKLGSSRQLVGRYVPQCSGDGGYKPEQCHASTGYCWCVNVFTGKEINGTRTRGPLHCSRALSKTTSNSVIDSGRQWIGDMEEIKPSAENGWSVSASVGSDKDTKQTKPSSANKWRISGSIGSGRDAKQSRALSDAISPPIMPGLEKLTIWSPGGYPIEDMEQTKPSAKNGWSVSASVGSDKDTKQTKPSSANKWRISGSIGSGRDAKQSRALSDAISPPAMPGLEKLTIWSPRGYPIEDMDQTKPSAKNGWSASASVGSDKDAQQTKPSSANKWRISGSIGSGRDAKQNKPSAKNKWSVGASVGSGKSWSVSGSVGSGKDAKHTIPAARRLHLICDMIMKKTQR